MNIIRLLNNNVIVSQDENGNEVIIMGRGIGFQKKIGEPVPEDKIDKLFKLSDTQQSRFAELVKDISYENMKLATQIIAQSKEFLGCRLSSSVYLTLMDHLNLAIERHKAGTDFENPLLWEIKKYYPNEFEAGMKAIELIRKETGIALNESEAGSLALHLINAELDGDISQSMKLPHLVKEVLNIIRYTLMVDFQEDSFAYERMVTHLKYYIQRALSMKYDYDEPQKDLFDVIVACYGDEFSCARKIGQFINKQTGFETPDEELMYLAAHINRVIRHHK